MKNKIAMLWLSIMEFFGFHKRIAQKAYDLLKDIPKEKWITFQCTDERSKCCFLGHYKRLISENPNDYRYNNITGWENTDLNVAIQKFLTKVHKIAARGHHVNDSIGVNGYSQDHAKDRCIALLKDMIKHGY